jgi:hypothetical protein
MKSIPARSGTAKGSIRAGAAWAPRQQASCLKISGLRPDANSANDWDPYSEVRYDIQVFG